MQTIAGHCYCRRGDRGLRQQFCCGEGRGVVQSGRKQNHQIESPAVNTMSVRLSASDRQFTLIAIFVHSTGPDQQQRIAVSPCRNIIFKCSRAFRLGPSRVSLWPHSVVIVKVDSDGRIMNYWIAIGLQSRERRRYFPLHFISCPMWFFRRDNESSYLTMASFNFNAGLYHL